MHDLVIRGGTLVDGTGRPAATGDVAVEGGIIREVGHVTTPGRREIAADGLLVTPGWVDLHTHYDGQVTWDSQLAPSFWQGVTTLLMGNCGVGFAPVRPDRRAWLIELMEGVEDIPGTALSDGIQWQWESFPDYLDALARSPHAMDVGAMMGHGALRSYVMDERGAANEAPTPDDLARMHQLVADAMAAGSFGVSTSRTIGHRALDGRPVPGTFADHQELRAIATSIAAAGHGQLQVAPAGLAAGDWADAMDEIGWITALSAETGCPISYLLAQQMDNAEEWRDRLNRTLGSAASGARVTPQVFARGVGLLSGLAGWFHPFMAAPAWQGLASLPLAARLERIRNDASLQARLAAEGRASAATPPAKPGLGPHWFEPWDRIYRFANQGDYEPDAADSIAGIAAASGRDPWAVALDLLLREGAFLWCPVLGYAGGNLDPLREMILDDRTVMGGSDGGAHCSFICDGSSPTFMLTHWVRDRRRGARLPLEFVIRKQTFDAARSVGLSDRGRLLPGLRADINLIDFAALDCGPAHMVADLPGGAQRLMQKASGYVATLVAGQPIREGADDTGARPGRLVRSVAG